MSEEKKADKTPVSDELVFDNLELVELPVIVGDKSYTLREANGGAACQYRNALIECTKLGPGGVPTQLKGIASVEPLLVSLCLFDEKGKRVPTSTIEKWPARVQKALFEKAKEISELGEDEEGETAGNVPAGITDGSD